MPIVSNKSEAVQWYIEHGFTLFPLIGKIPPKGFFWRNAKYDPFAEFVGNFGVQLQAEDLVIDVDPRNFQENVNSLALLENALGEPIAPTLTVLTGSGGQHLYFKKPKDFKIRKSLKGLPGLDFLSEGCYVVGAGSIHPQTERLYELHTHSIIKAPETLLNLLEKKPIDVLIGVKDYVTDEQTITRYRDYLKTAETAIEGSNGDETTFKVSAIGRDFGLSPQIVLDCLLEDYNPRCEPPWELESLKQKVNNAYKYAEGSLGSKAPSIAFPKEKEIQVWSEEQNKYFHRNENDKIKLDKHNTALMFAPTFPLEGLLAMDLFSHNIIFTRRAPWQKIDGIKIWDDNEATLCSHWLSTNYKYEPKKEMMHEAAIIASYQYQFHPVKDYWESLVWDGHKRLHNWMSIYLGATDDAYTRAVGMKTLVACCKRVYEPGCKFDYITVLEGEQGSGKSTAWRILAGKTWFGDTPIDISKEWSIMKTFGKLMYEWAEMETFRKSNTQAMRAFLSSDTDTVRLPYNRTIQAIARQGIFVGTFNPEKDKDIGWLHDTTGNRRYWVVATGVEGDIRNDKLESVRDQLWAEAFAIYKSGMTIHFEDAEVIEQAQVEQAKRLGRDSWYDAIQAWLEAQHNTDKHIFTGDEIYKECIGGMLTTYKRPEMVRIANIMIDLGWIKSVHYHPNLKRSVNGYRRPILE